MKRKKQADHISHDRWLVSYADFITLLFAFFVVLFASSQSDKKKQTALAAAMQNAFTPMAAFETHSKTPPLASGASASTTPVPIQPPMATTEQLAAQVENEVRKRLHKIVEEEEAANRIVADSITMHTSDDGFVISLHEAGFFASGSADIRPTSIPMIQKIAAALPSGRVRIEGHTDNVPIHTAQFSSNWELSTSRAARVARIFLERLDTNPADLSAAGYAEFHPFASNLTETGRAQNRRIDVILLRPYTSTVKQSPPAPLQ